MAMGIEVGRTGRKGVPGPDMNVTPLVDVCLVLLIIFMVITPLLSKQFWIHLPQQEEVRPAAPAATPDDQGPVVISVDRAGRIRINRDEVTAAELERRLPRILAARADRAVFFDAADDADYAVAVGVLDRARGAGATSIAVLTKALDRPR